MRVKQCCCGCSLRAGTLAIGYFYAITGFVCAVVCFALMEELRDVLVDGFPQISQIVIIALAVGGTTGLVQLLVSVPLIYGVYMEKKEFLAAWIVFVWICIGLSLVTVFLSVVELAASNTVSFHFEAVGCALYACLLWYFLVVVRSYGKFLTLQKDVQMAILLANEIVV